MIRDWFDKLTNAFVYIMSLFGMTISKMSYEQWYFTLSLLLGLIALGLNVWHKRQMQKIASERGVTINETD
ncbi:hypothetical protein [uncultured Vibrio sp.]|uniref:hypothetical protein n=1 Tax=uncultured Vibrio sp. TaxID=114054 RepID=UPI0025E490ED|nr:hypothetical protein [uncultured Vibrio sp.]